MDLKRKVQTYLNKTGISQKEFVKRVGGIDKSRVAEQLGHKGFYRDSDIEKINKFFEDPENSKWVEPTFKE